MSAGTYWAPPAKGIALNVTSKFLHQLLEIRGEHHLGGCGRYSLNNADVARLTAMKVMDPHLQAPCEELIEAIEKFGVVEIWHEY